ncbi:hypothetical protein GCM10009839_61770 [Catenulispora yoronensis]|uniref:SUKH-4 immunity protein of toxin-antitoxin system n=1 Tax=Catenulispora yoronensis TaxID=450799 RepID=A0ABP5GN15_9ACTN
MPNTDSAEDLLRRLTADEETARSLEIHAGFDALRPDPLENLSIPCGLPLVPIAGDGAGGTFYLVGDESAERRPVLYTDSEGAGSLVAEDLAEALSIFIALGFWHDVGYGIDLDAVEADLRENEPDIDEARAELFATVGVPVISREQARDLLLAAAARTAPDYVALADFADAVPYSLMFGPRPWVVDPAS